MNRYIATYRLTSSARPSAIAYVFDRKMGRVVLACEHRHVSRRFSWTKEGRRRIMSTVYARRCSERLLRKWLREHAEVT